MATPTHLWFNALFFPLTRSSCSEIMLLTRVALWELSASNSVWRGWGLIALSQLPRDFICLSGKGPLLIILFGTMGVMC